ncbi:MAG: GNAT family N-acetyltransferase [Anaerolineales bacterium]|nr:GNAT family N-acetyltransferase [Anaerolineales bacterium]
MLFSATTPTHIRPAEKNDHLALSNLFHFEAYNFRHLDWKRPIDWLGTQPFLVAEQKGRLVAALVCPPDSPGVAWVRAFVAAGQIPVEQVWQALWQEAYRELEAKKITKIAAICMEPWMQKLLMSSGFRRTDAVVVLAWDPASPLAPPRFPARPRVMVPEDFPNVYAVDQACFVPLWQNSQPILELAFAQAIFATVVEDETGLIGYQISTPSPRGGHLARLGVHPRAQGRGIGYALVYDLLVRLAAHPPVLGSLQVTVNTQAENAASLAVYKKANFQFTGHQYPVYEYF